ncbi:MAG TPA: zf-HC2 domain-containing protein [Polaromonas sp.]|uniref:zf-HC2 domain-containing protein n=1 Tax=Polaromonas sp. TaxID=1869339 RepID=UPI002D640D72|nr:zf-HC2 domain-containing protein [Polaromonas sp.]HYW55498.1 zf-HC2 domain-containing protein [Polaromonas sp.]
MSLQIPLRRTCKEAAALLVAREDRALSLPDAVALKLHLMACRSCPEFENQMLTMRLAMDRWRQDLNAADTVEPRL